MKKTVMLACAVMALVGCKQCVRNDEPAAAKTADDNDLVVETVAVGLEVPWAMAFTPDGRLLITERPGRLRVVANDKLLKEPVAVLPDVVSKNESGLLGLALHPNFAANQWLYLCYTTEADGRLKEMVKRFRLSDTGLVDEKLVLDKIPAALNHDGCRLKFGPDSKLYVTTGDAADRELAQKLDSLAGKILRLSDDGSVPQDNPFVNNDKARPEIWSYGHRNPQGLDWQPGTNWLFETEHGPSGWDGPGGGDEVNIVERGKNYGWPVIHHRMEKDSMKSPILEYTPAIAPSGATFYRSTAIPKWHNSFFFACLRGQRIMRVRFDGKKAIETQELFKDSYGRIRDVVEGPDMALYFATSNRDGRASPVPEDDRILRIRLGKDVLRH